MLKKKKTKKKKSIFLAGILLLLIFSALPAAAAGQMGSLTIYYYGTTPETFKYAAQKAVEQVKDKDPEHRIIFLNSWNEWGEGAYMEPDLEFGKGKIEALAEVLSNE